ncbi:MAG: hypothetical protein HYT73_03605 [Candidatus Aenigmarchaeota archaeon]|nr:hypothetical protein [Candidatus Aenigmarchaeota archaeon]
MKLEDYPHYFLYLLVIYLFMLAYGLNFILKAIEYGILDGVWPAAITALILAPAALLAAYSMRSRSLMLYSHWKALRYAAAVMMALSSAFIGVFVLPLGF